MSGELELQPKGEVFFRILRVKRRHSIFYKKLTRKEEDETVWKREWGGDIIFSHGSYRSRGVCILIDPSKNIKSEHSFKDSNGRIVLTTTD